MNSRTFHIRIKEWFPPGDEVAAIMAQLCVLREDLYLEMLGLHADEIMPLDANGNNYRSIYFFRNSTRTLFEIRNAVETLKIEKTFLRSNSKCNTAGPEGLRCCHDKKMLHTLEC
jgi:hypothetical protein